jgi:hypothetical protein
MHISLKLLVRGLGGIYLLAFLSLASQVIPLFGSNGILPMADSVSYFGSQVHSKWLVLPSLFWLGSSDALLKGAVWIGVILSGVMIVGRRFSLLAAIGTWCLYLSFVNLGMPFMSFQWDILLLEAGFLAILVECGVAPTVMVWAFRLLVFKVMFASGVVKLASGDPLWRNLEALSVHYLTQPLPHIGGWYIHRLPAWFHTLSTFLMFVIELVIPFFVFGNRLMRRICAGLFCGLMVMVALTGNYTFFNLLIMVLSLSLLINTTPILTAIRSITWKHWTWSWGGAVVAICLMSMSMSQEIGRLSTKLPDPLATLRQPLTGFRLINGYGLFAVMTPHRDEISIEGSLDGRTWVPYDFKYKPDSLNEAPQWVWPHQPRLDWQMWFAALSTIERNYWLQRFAVRLLEGNETVTSLLAHNPFEGQAPHIIRMTRYRYEFTSLEERQASGQWWKRQAIGTYCSPVALPRKISSYE